MAKKKTDAERKAEAALESAAFLAKFRSLVQPDDIIATGMKLGAIERQRKFELPTLVEATILALSTLPGTQMTAYQNYLALAEKSVAPSTFYGHFNAGFGELMKEVAQRALQAVRECTPGGSPDAESGALQERFRDICITDSTALFLKRFAQGWARSTSKVRPAAIKLHTTISLADALPTHSQVTGQRLHDTQAFPEEALATGTLHLFDLGYIDIARFIRIHDKGAFFLTRLKASHNPKVLRVHVGGGARVACRGRLLDEVLADGSLVLQGSQLDVDVELASGTQRCVARVVGIADAEDGMHWYLTNVTRDVLDAADVAETYRLRWLVELVFKQVKSGLGLDAILAWREPAVKALVYSKVVALCLARLLQMAVASHNENTVVTQLAMVMVLARSTGLFIAHHLLAEGLSLAEFEGRIMRIAIVAARARNQRREREKRKRQAQIGR